MKKNLPTLPLNHSNGLFKLSFSTTKPISQVATSTIPFYIKQNCPFAFIFSDSKNREPVTKLLKIELNIKTKYQLLIKFNHYSEINNYTDYE